MNCDIDHFALDLDRPLETSRGTITRREGFLVRLEADGTDGVGEATPLPGWTESIGECRDALDRAASIVESEEYDAALGALSPYPAARHGVSLALADMHARQAGTPLYQYLGGNEHSCPRFCSSVPVNATIGDSSVEETVEAAEKAVDQGYDCLKCKVGGRSIDSDIERLRAVRDAIGERELRGDANGAWNRSQAVRAFEAFEDIGVSYVEQPLSPSDIEGHAALREREPDVGVALDESLTQTSIKDIISAGAADVLVLKPMVVGGVDPARDMAAMAHEAGQTPVVTTTIDGAYARAAAVHVAASIPDVPACGLATGDRLTEDLVSDPVPVDTGRIAVPQGEGNGNIPRRPTETNA